MRINTPQNWRRLNTREIDNKSEETDFGWVMESTRAEIIIRQENKRNWSVIHPSSSENGKKDFQRKEEAIKFAREWMMTHRLPEDIPLI